MSWYDFDPEAASEEAADFDEYCTSAEGRAWMAACVEGADDPEYGEEILDLARMFFSGRDMERLVRRKGW